MSFNYKTKPYEHQEEALLRSFNRKTTMPILWKWVVVNQKY